MVIKNQNIPNAQWFNDLFQTIFSLFIILVYVFYIINIHYNPIIIINSSTETCWLNSNTYVTTMDLMFKSTLAGYFLFGLVGSGGIGLVIEIGWRIFLTINTSKKDDRMDEFEFTI